MKLNTLTLTQSLQKLKKKEISVQEIHSDVHQVIEEKNPRLNAYLALDYRSSEEAGRQTDTPLSGIPVAVKDNFLTVGLTTTASSNVLKEFAPPYESTVTKRLKKAGGVVVGKTNMDAWAHGSSTETSDFGTSRNPRNPAYSPGGSSGGSASAVGADLCIAALGSETAGSIRIPAAWCGIVGVKPTYGRVSRAGVVAMGSSLDSPGPMTKTVEDAAVLLSLIAGKDPYDATTSANAVPDYTKSLGQGVKGLNIGIVYMDHPLMPEEVKTSVSEAGKLFEKHGAKVDTIKLSPTVQKNTILHPDYAIGVYTVVQRSEVSSNLARYDGIRYGNPRAFFGSEAKRRIMLGTFTLSTGYADKYYVRAQQVRHLYIQNFQQLFSAYDLLVSTPSPGYAPKVGSSEGNPMFGEVVDMLNEPSSLAGLPAASIPCYKDEQTGLYLGLSIMANHFEEEKIFRAASLYEQETHWNSWK
jgi:aspartyl-tRNA(Asn)/glutamyl-tRNA(Gln) amidotransferase subunit A